jgi:hypothetical protein
MPRCSSQSRYVDYRPPNHTSGQEYAALLCVKFRRWHVSTHEGKSVPLSEEFRSRSRGLRTVTKFSGETFDDDVRAYGNVERDECRQARSENSDERHRRGENSSYPNVPGYRCEHSLFWRPCSWRPCIMCTQPNLRTCEVTQIFFKRVGTGESASASGRYHVPEMCWR